MGPDISDRGGTPAEVAAQLYAALAAGQDRTIARLLHPRARLRVPGRSPLSDTYIGHDGLDEFTTRAVALAPGGARTAVLEIMPWDTHVAVLGVSHASREGRADLQNTTLHLLRVSGGQVLEVEILNLDQDAVDRFWS